MPLDERQLAMLREMGVPFWQPLSRQEAALQPEPVVVLKYTGRKI